MTAAPGVNGSIPDYPRDVRGMAAALLERRCVPVPVRYRDKKAIEDDWNIKRPTAADLDKLFPAGEDRNIGILLGHASGGLVDIDLDSDEALRAASYYLPPTGWVSGRKGAPRSHHWYIAEGLPDEHASEKYDGGVRKGDDRSTLLELRTDTYMTVAPPSTHPSGERYGWYAWGEPAKVPFKELRTRVERLAAACLIGRLWPKGSRNDAALALAGGLLRAGWVVEEAERFVGAVAVAARDEEAKQRAGVVAPTKAKLDKGEKVTGWPKLTELLGTHGGLAMKHVGRWLHLPDPKKATITPPEPFRPFPVEALPEPLRQFVVQGAVAFGCDPSFFALPALSVTAALVGNSKTIFIKRGWQEPSVVWTCIVGDSGTLKSPALGAVMRPLYRIQKDLRKKFKTDLEDYEKAKLAYEEKKKQAKKDGKAFTEDEPEEPTMHRVVAGDLTIEKLAELLEDNPKGILVSRDELGGWLASFQRYKGKAGGSDLPCWLEMSRAGTLQVDRKTGDRRTLFIQNAAVSITGGIQPGPLARALTAEHMECGLAARLLMVMPPKRKKRWTESVIAPEVQDAYEQLLRRLMELQLDKEPDGEKAPFAVKLTPEAKAAWVAFYEEWAAEQAAVEGELAAAYSKLEGYAARLALIHHVVTRVGDLEDNQPIDPASIEAGVALIRWFAYETRRIYRVLVETEDARLVRKLVEFLRSRDGSAKARDLRRACPSRYQTPEEAEAALQVLVDHELADWSERPAGSQGGRPTKVCVLKPYHDKTDETPDDDGPEDEVGPDETTDETPPPDGNSPVSEGFVSFGVSSMTSGEATNGPAAGGRCEEVSSAPPQQNSSEQGERGGVEHVAPNSADKTDETTASYTLITDPAGLEIVRSALADTAVVGLDCETTGLDPRTDRVRLLQLATDTISGGTHTYIVDCFVVDPSPLWEGLAERPVVAHNGAFDLGFLAALGFTPGVVHDTMLSSLLVNGARRPKGFHRLGEAAERELGRTLDKAEQKGDWSGALTTEQLAYAAADAAVLPELNAALSAKIAAAELGRVAEIERRCLPAVAWMGRMGVGFDRAAWDALADETAGRAEELARRLDAEAPARPGRLIQNDAWNWSSPEQVKEAFAALGVTLESTDDDALAAVNHPLAGLLRDHRSAAKLTSTYGPKWYAKALHDGRVYAGWRQVGADSGRMACSAPNLQNLPRDVRYRRCFIAPAGRRLVKADYSQIELRIAARVARERVMLDAYHRGEDLHTATARTVLGVEAPTKDQRQVAKSLNFGLLYGMGAKMLRVYARSNYGVELTEGQAAEYRAAFFRAYPGLAAWHRSIGSSPIDTRTLTGRRREKVTRYTEKLNTPVQGTGADGLKQALAVLWERRADCPGAFPVLAVHDEIVVECDEAQADAVKAWLTQAMVDGMAGLIAPVPVEVEVKAGQTWAGDCGIRPRNVPDGPQ